MLSDYADEQYRDSAKPFIGPLRQGENRLDIDKDRPKFKFFGGVYRLSDMELPFLIDLPNGSCEGVFTMAAKNAGCDLVPIVE